MTLYVGMNKLLSKVEKDSIETLENLGYIETAKKTKIIKVPN
jgi:hypothetical protein